MPLYLPSYFKTWTNAIFNVSFPLFANTFQWKKKQRTNYSVSFFEFVSARFLNWMNRFSINMLRHTLFDFIKTYFVKKKKCNWEKSQITKWQSIKSTSVLFLILISLFRIRTIKSIHIYAYSSVLFEQLRFEDI